MRRGAEPDRLRLLPNVCRRRISAMYTFSYAVHEYAIGREAALSSTLEPSEARVVSMRNLIGRAEHKGT
jgi:hypothetical protein